MNPEPLRLAVVADIHHGRDFGTKRGSQALGCLADFLGWAEGINPDLIVDLGDRITDHSTERDLALAAEVAAAFAVCHLPRLHVDGNHDRHHLSAAQNAACLGQPVGSRVVTVRGWRIIAWQPGVVYRSGQPFSLEDGALDWLAETLAADPAPAVIVSHVPVGGQSMTGNYYFDRNPDGSTYGEQAAIRAVAERSGTVAMWLSGHVHWNSLSTIMGLPHVTVQSLTESATTGGLAAGAFSDVRLSPGGIEITVHGRDPMGLRLPLPFGRPRWRQPGA